MPRQTRPHLIVHGHFYQPPRENPWTGEIERQEAATPYHDWNARIAAECYLPNAFSRVLDAAGRIRSIVNNYAAISFNFGPTLLSWLEAHAPRAYARILEADRESLKRRGGHGNAIAQAYNHMILPLASRRDKVTQVRWGLADFRAHFRRAPEGLWLPECAVDRETLEVLVAHGLRFVILSPDQARRVRPREGGAWRPASEALDRRRPYRYSIGEGSIDVLFFDGALSRAVAFQHLLQDAGAFADRVEASFAASPDGEPLTLVCTDGESYGHHERFGDMCLASLLEVEASRRGFVVTNPAAYLEAHPPAHEVELHFPSAWSCAHGVARWADDCGCHTGGEPDWRQAWRKPLRAALDRLRAELDRIFEEQAGALFRDPWAARDEALEILRDPSPAAFEAFVARHARRPLNPGEAAGGRRLLEMARQAMLMYTSCGWFFAELSGIEAVQNLRYAACAIDLARPFTALDLEARLEEDLARAPSNLPTVGDGRRLWERSVRPSRVPLTRAAAALALDGWFAASGPEPPPAFEAVFEDASREEVNGETVFLGRLTLRAKASGEEAAYAFLVHRHGPADLGCHLVPSPGPEGWPPLRSALLEAAAAGEDAVGRLERIRGGAPLALADLLPQDRQALVTRLAEPALGRLRSQAMAALEETEPIAEAFTKAGLPFPPWLQALTREALGEEFRETVERLGGDPDSTRYGRAFWLLERARQLGLRLDLEPARAVVQRAFDVRIAALEGRPGGGVCREATRLIQLAERLGMPLDLQQGQGVLLAILDTPGQPFMDAAAAGDPAAYVEAAALLELAGELNLTTETLRTRLRPVEERLATDPGHWP